MFVRQLSSICCMAMILFPSAYVLAQETPNSPPKKNLVSYDAVKVPFTDYLTDIGAQTGHKVLIESTVDASEVTMCVQNIEFEDSLTFACKGRDCEWRKVYLPLESPLAAKPDELAKAVRSVESMAAPQVIVISGAQQYGTVRVSNGKSWPSLDGAKAAGWVELYLITNDGASGLKTGSGSKADDYASQQKQLFDVFLKMDARDRRLAAASTVDLLLRPEIGYGRAFLSALQSAADKPLPEQCSASLPFVLQLAKYGRNITAESQVDKLVDSVPVESLETVREQLKKALDAVDARLKQKQQDGN